MQVEVKELEKHKKSIAVEIPKEEVNKRLQGVYEKVSHSIAIPGFRKGKVPLKVLKLYYGEEIKEQVKEELIEENYKKAIKEKDIRVASEAEVKKAELDEDKPFKFEAVVEAFPEAKIGEYKGIEAERQKVEVSDEEVNAVLERKREENAQLIPVNNRPAQKGDLITIDYQVEIDNKIVRDMKDQKLILGKTPVPKEWDEALIGLKVGETEEVKTKSKGEKAKNILYRFTVKKIEERRLLVLTDDFAKKMGGFESLEKLKDKIREELEELARFQEEEHLKDVILDKIIENSKIEVPPSVVEKFSKYYAVINQGLTEEESRKLAEKNVKTQIIVDEIAKKENIEVSNAELAREKSRMASGEKEEDLREELRREKVIKFLIENAQVKSKGRSMILTPEEAGKLSSRKKLWRRRDKIIKPGE